MSTLRWNWGHAVAMFDARVEETSRSKERRVNRIRHTSWQPRGDGQDCGREEGCG